MGGSDGRAGEHFQTKGKIMSVAIRILLRYGSAALVAKGLLPDEQASMIASDPEFASLIEMGAGLALGAVAEGWYWAARKFGWNK